MPELLSPWDEYLRLQTRSSRRQQVDSYSWGMEEEMNLFLENPAAENLARANASAARRERAQAALRNKHAAELAPMPTSLDKQLEARAALRCIEGYVSQAEWRLLIQLGQEFTQAEIAKGKGMKPGTVRAAVFQLRSQLQHLRPAA